MSRIRSVHPGLWTDDDFVSMSLAARLFLIGMWNEADDYGLFQWKPLRLKMRLAPADNVDAEALLGELAAAGFIVRLSRAGKDFGAVKNFRKFQRPQKPSASLIPLDDEIKEIIGLPVVGSGSPSVPLPDPTVPLPDHSGSPPVPLQDHSGSPPGIRPQMEEVRWKGSKESSWGTDAGGREGERERDQKIEAECRRIGATSEKPPPVLVDQNFVCVLKLLDDDASLTEADVYVGMTAVIDTHHPLKFWTKLEPWVRRAAKDRMGAAMPAANYARAGPSFGSPFSPFAYRPEGRTNANGTSKTLSDVLRGRIAARAGQPDAAKSLT